MDATALGVAAASWGVLMALSPVLQIRRILQRGSSEDVSIGYFIVLLVGFSLWIAYGVARSDAVLILPNTIAVLVTVTTVGIALRYR
ncbi:MAG: SemiSWEET family sugar transporter [Actinomycetota bacterium]